MFALKALLLISLCAIILNEISAVPYPGQQGGGGGGGGQQGTGQGQGQTQSMLY